MGWASGSELFVNVYETVRPFVPEKDKKAVCRDLMRHFENCDWDCQEEVECDDWPEVREINRENAIDDELDYMSAEDMKDEEKITELAEDWDVPVSFVQERIRKMKNESS